MYFIVLGRRKYSRDFPKAEFNSQERLLQGLKGPWNDIPAILKLCVPVLSKQKCYAVKVSCLPINPRNFSTSNDLQYTVIHAYIIT